MGKGKGQKDKNVVARGTPAKTKGLKAEPVVSEIVDGQVFRVEDSEDLIFPIGSFDRQLATKHKTYELFWVVPDGSDSRGLATELGDVHVEFENIGPIDLQIVALRALGYEQDPSAVASYTSIWGSSASKGLKVGEVARSTIKHVNNEIVVPNRALVGGRECVSIFHLLVIRENLSESGVAVVDRDGTMSLAIKIRQVYEAARSGDQSGEWFAMRSYSSEDHLKFRHPLPPPPIAISALRVGAGLVRRCCLTPCVNQALDEGRFGAVLMKFSANTAGDISDVGPEGMDTEVIYSMDDGVLAMSPLYFEDPSVETAPHSSGDFQKSSMNLVNSRYLGWFDEIPADKTGWTGKKGQKGWYLLSRRPWDQSPATKLLCLAYMTFQKKSPTWSNGPMPAVSGVGWLSITTVVTPVMSHRWKKFSLRTRVPSEHVCFRAEERRDLHSFKAGLSSDFLDKLLSATTKIIKVVTTVASIISFMGFGRLQLSSYQSPNLVEVEGDFVRV